MQQQHAVYRLSDVPSFSNMIHSVSYSTLDETTYLNKVQMKTQNNHIYYLVRYDKSIMPHYLYPIYGLCRSVLLNKDQKMVCFSPPKSVLCETFIAEQQANQEDIVFEEFVEGTMINIFWDPVLGINGSWEIATRNNVGAECSFYKSRTSKTFRAMFFEAAIKNGLYLYTLNKAYCYSFVLQHPDNRIVVPFSCAQLYLVAVYKIEHVYDKEIYVHVIDRETMQSLFVDTRVRFPIIYKDISCYKEAIDNYASMNTPYHILGVVIYNKTTGQRCKIRNPNYEQVRLLRGNQPKLQYRYLTLRKEGKLSEYLKYFQEHRSEFSSFRDHLHLYTNTLYKNYVSCYIKKENPWNKYPSDYRNHMLALHQIYRQKVEPIVEVEFTKENENTKKWKLGKKCITKQVVIDYVNKLNPSQIMYSLNYHLRQRDVDCIVALKE